MPVYLNPKETSVTYNSEAWRPKETKPVSFFVPDELGLTLMSENPRVSNQVLSSGVRTLAVGETLRLYIPECKSHIATIAVKSGILVVRENYDDNEIFTQVDEGMSYMATRQRPLVEAYYLTNADSGETEIEYHVSRAYTGV